MLKGSAVVPGFNRSFRCLYTLIFLACCIASLTAPVRRVQAQDVPVIAAASSLQFALTDIVAAYRADTGREILLSFGSSGNLARQIRQGAPFELFLSADDALVRDLARDDVAQDDGVIYAVGRLAMIVPRGSPLAADGTLKSLAAALEAEAITRFAIANPDHAPYGARAAEALRHAGLWDALAPRLVYGENIAQAAQFAISGHAQGGIVAYSLARSDAVASRADHALIAESWHRPLHHRMVLVKGAGVTAQAFFRYMQGARARGILDMHGFAPPNRPS